MNCTAIASTVFRSLSRSVRSAVIGVFAVLLVSCGGGGLSELAGGVGSGGSGLAEGTITGFGSVYVDGVRYDDSRAVLTQQAATGEQPVSVLKLGQRVRVRSSTSGVADSIEVISELIGPIDAVEGFAGGQWLTVLGQRVRVDRSVGAAAGADTWVDFGDAPCAALATCTLQPGQWVQVHGSWVLDEANNRDQLLASRVELVDPQSNVLLSGVVRQVTGQSVRLNAPNGREISLDATAPGSPPAVEQLLRVWAPAASKAQPSLPASRAVASPLVADAAVSSTVLGGEIGKVSADGREIEIQGTKIAVPPALQLAGLNTGRFARVEIERGPNGWQLKGAPDLPDNANRAAVQISGEIQAAGLSAAQAGIWRLRETTLVTVSAQQMRDGGCLGFNPSDRVRVEVKALRGPLPLRIDSIRCSRP